MIPEANKPLLVVAAGLLAIPVSDCADGFMLDSYPRTLNQAIALQSQLRPKDKIVVIEIDVDPERMIARMVSRLICSKCASVYNSETLKPRTEGICDTCGSTLRRRSDDQEGIIVSGSGPARRRHFCSVLI